MLSFTHILARSTEVGTRSRNLYGTSIALAIHSLDPTRLTITDGFPFNPTYDF